jgi:hypothetical protein
MVRAHLRAAQLHNDLARISDRWGEQARAQNYMACASRHLDEAALPDLSRFEAERSGVWTIPGAWRYPQ